MNIFHDVLIKQFTDAQMIYNIISNGESSHFVNSRFVNIDQMRIDKVGIDKVGITHWSMNIYCMRTTSCEDNLGYLQNGEGGW